MPDMPSRRDLLFDWEHAFDQRFVLYLVVGVAAVLLGAFAILVLHTRQARVAADARADLIRRYASWLALTLFLLISVLLGAGPTIVAIGVLSLLCYREYARATGLFREKMVSVVVVLTLVGITAAVFDNWYRMCVALTPLSIGLLGAVTLLADRPKGYVQRVALGVVGVILFGTCLGHVGYLANLAQYRSVVLWLLATSLLQPLLAAATRRLSGPLLLPNTAPRQTLFATLGAILLTTAVGSFLGFFALAETTLAGAVHPLVLGLLVGVVGALSGLMLAAVRRDLGVAEPTTARLLDRTHVLILAAPVVYCYIHFIYGIGV